jgi:O-antigen biosynthesis protein
MSDHMPDNRRAGIGSTVKRTTKRASQEVTGREIVAAPEDYQDGMQEAEQRGHIILKFLASDANNAKSVEQNQNYETRSFPEHEDNSVQRKDGPGLTPGRSAAVLLRKRATVSGLDAPFLLLVETPRPDQLVIPGRSISISGLAVSMEPIKEVAVTLGNVTEFAKFGLHRPDLAEEFPSLRLVSQSGFSCALRAIPNAGTKRINLTVVARTVGGQESKVESSLKFATVAESTAESSFHGPMKRLIGDREAAMRFSIDQAWIDRRGFLRISGWVIAHARIEAIEVFIDGAFIGTAEYGLKRPDVELAWPDYTAALKSGFVLAADAQHFPERMQVKIKAKASGGLFREATVLVRRSAVALRRTAQEVHELVCDESLLTRSGLLRLSGWAVSSTGIKQIGVVFEGNIVGVAQLGGERPDVGNKFPTIPGSRQSGFKFKGRVAPETLKNEHILVIELVLANGDVASYRVALAPRDLPIPSASEPAADLRVFVDEPEIVNGAAAQPINAGLSIVGWALASDHVNAVVVELDHTRVGDAYYGMRREDIAAAFPNHSGSLLSGFAFSLPRRALTDGQHVVGVKVITKTLREQRLEFNIDVAPGDEKDGPWSLRRRVSAAECQLAKTLIGHLRREPKFFIWLKIVRADVESMRITLLSIKEQIYVGWTVVLVGTPASSKAAAELISSKFSEVSSRIHWLTDEAGLPDLCLATADQECWIMPLHAGDILSVDALLEFCLLADRDQSADLIYADDRRLNPASGRIEAFFKPQWSPDLLLSTNYIGLPCCVRHSVLRRATLSARQFLEFGHYDFVLNCTEQARNVAHIPQVLGESRPDAFEPRKIEMRALRGAVKRRRFNAVVESGRINRTYRVRRKGKPTGLVSIIIPTCASRGLIKTCIESIRALTTYRDIEIICVDNILDETSEWKFWLRDRADTVIEIAEPFNWSRFNNIAAREASGSFLLFLNDDMEVIQPDWLEPMIGLATRPEVGVVGPQLLYPDRKVQHAGLFLSGLDTARHAFRYCEESDPGYHGLALTQRNVIGLTGACMLMRTEVFNRLGGFDEAHAIVNNDVDFCLKAHAAKLWNVFTPFSRLIHHELASRAHIKDQHDESAFGIRWQSLIAHGDPFFHRNLSKSSDSYRYEPEPVRTVLAGHPLYLSADIRNVLAIKVDHIGDFLTAFPAFQRIKERFPKCRLHVLASPAARQLAALESAIDNVIEFEFFHARSSLGKKDVDEKEVDALAAKLAPLDIDIAIDLRKSPDTRHLLRCTGAKWSAGFDWLNQFPWLDIALTWEGDARLAPKRNHVADDLINLVDAVAAAGIAQRDTIRRLGKRSTRRFSVTSQLEREGLYERRVVCLHPVCGNELRQWPPEYFASIGDSLIECEDVNVAVIGGLDEREIADRMLTDMKRQDRATSLVGRLDLAELPYFLKTCALFVGNNSGPKHIAAALGVPTVGIHSGVVDPREWGPLGKAAVAVRRDMTCAPCYSEKREDCHRGLACLLGLSPAEVLPMCRRLLAVGHRS